MALKITGNSTFKNYSTSPSRGEEASCARKSCFIARPLADISAHDAEVVFHVLVDAEGDGHHGHDFAQFRREAPVQAPRAFRPHDPERFGRRAVALVRRAVQALTMAVAAASNHPEGKSKREREREPETPHSFKQVKGEGADRRTFHRRKKRRHFKDGSSGSKQETPTHARVRSLPSRPCLHLQLHAAANHVQGVNAQRGDDAGERARAEVDCHLRGCQLRIL